MRYGAHIDDECGEQGRPKVVGLTEFRPIVFVFTIVNTNDECGEPAKRRSAQLLAIRMSFSCIEDPNISRRDSLIHNCFISGAKPPFG